MMILLIGGGLTVVGALLTMAGIDRHARAVVAERRNACDKRRLAALAGLVGVDLAAYADDAPDHYRGGHRTSRWRAVTDTVTVLGAAWAYAYAGPVHSPAPAAAGPLARIYVLPALAGAVEAEGLTDRELVAA